jgi:hypothetical protein
VVEGGRELTVNDFFRVSLAVLVKLPSFLTELDEDVELGTLAPIDGLRLARDDPARVAVESVAPSPESLYIRLDDSSRKRDLFAYMDSRVFQRHTETPHVCSTEVLGKAKLNVIDIAGMLELIRYLLVSIDPSGIDHD